MTESGQWWIENVLEECDDAREYFFDPRTRTLYYNPNSTSEGPTGEEAWVATQQRVLFRINGTMASPVRDVTIQGLSLRDTRFTYLDPHGMPTGGDWALQRSGAITAEGTEGLAINENGTPPQPVQLATRALSHLPPLPFGCCACPVVAVLTRPAFGVVVWSAQSSPTSMG